MSSSRRNRHAFTLVELLVVIAIIGILVALLLPAIQAAREASRRSQCSNNLKQLGLALQNHHDVYKRFPTGCANDLAPSFGTHATGANWGSSWYVYILPYIEMGTMYGNWVLDGTSSGFQNANNLALRQGVVINGFRCPSSVLPMGSQNTSGAQPFGMIPTYAGIAGLAGGAILPNYTETRVSGGAANNNGWLSAGGVLFSGSKINLRDVTDGSSFVMAVSEQGDFMVDTAGNKNAFNASQPYGWSMGSGSSASPPAYGDRQFNCTTVRYPVNQKTGWPVGFANIGITMDSGQNTPLNSCHPGGVLALLCDGSVRFLADATALSVLGLLATRDDAQPVTLP